MLCHAHSLLKLLNSPALPFPWPHYSTEHDRVAHGELTAAISRRGLRRNGARNTPELVPASSIGTKRCLDRVGRERIKRHVAVDVDLDPCSEQFEGVFIRVIIPMYWYRFYLTIPYNTAIGIS